MSNGGAGGVVTAEDHGRRGSHHSEERRVLGALFRRHSVSSPRAVELQGGLVYFLYASNERAGGSPFPPSPLDRFKHCEAELQPAQAPA